MSAAIALMCLLTMAAGCVTDPARPGSDGPAAGLPHCPECPDIHPQVWADNRAWGPTFEFKVNCGPKAEDEPLESCFLWDLDAVTVHPPNGTTIALDKDFEINPYSGEVTRRWVLYGPDGAGLPTTGDYTFRYHANDTVRHEQTFRYEATLIGWPTNITHQRDGNDLHVSWTPPVDGHLGNSYKVLAFPESGGVFSVQLPKTATRGTLSDLPFSPGETYLLRVSLYWNDEAHGGGYATGPETWETW